MKKYILPLILPVLLFSNDITLKWLENKPKGVYKDFYIWRFLQQDISSNEALKAMEQVKYLGPPLLESFSKKYDDPSYKLYFKCKKMASKKIINEPAYCIEAGLSLFDATKLKKEEILDVMGKTRKDYPDFAKSLEVLYSPTPFKTMSSMDNKTFFSVFNECGSVYRQKYFNESFSLKLLNELKRDEKEFDRMIKRIVTNLKMTQAQKSLLYLEPKGLSFPTLFHLAINALKLGEEKFALNYLNEAYKKAYYQMQKDNITFWQYLITNEKKYLEKLSSSWDVNLYTLYANELSNKEPKNIVYDIKQNGKKSSYDINDPFQWLKVLNDTKKMDEEKMKKYEELFDSYDTLEHLAFVKERFHRYKKSYFITPFKDTISQYDTKRQALIYALARQESRFIPSSISFAYAMGTMQIMPFLSRSISKKMDEDYDIFKQLDSATNIKYADYHLDYLEKNLQHPLLIAYAYNGGIGFTRRSMKKGLFSKDKKNKYEPFLSMELLQFDETKKYGKKVLANYLIYYNHLNKEKIKLSELLDQIYQ